jgi:hypothetical protein
MDVQDALNAMRNLGVSLNESDTEALNILCDYAEYNLKLDKEEMAAEEEYTRLREEGSGQSV